MKLDDLWGDDSKLDYDEEKRLLKLDRCKWDTDIICPDAGNFKKDCETCKYNPENLVGANK